MEIPSDVHPDQIDKLLKEHGWGNWRRLAADAWNNPELRGFGAFSVKTRGARVGRNPRTGEAVSVDQKKVPFFKTGKLLRDRLNGKA